MQIIHLLLEFLFIFYLKQIKKRNLILKHLFISIITWIMRTSMNKGFIQSTWKQFLLLLFLLKWNIKLNISKSNISFSIHVRRAPQNKKLISQYRIYFCPFKRALSCLLNLILYCKSNLFQKQSPRRVL